jgi:hypothetical protein
VAALDKALSLSSDQKTKIEAIQKKLADDQRAIAPQAGGQSDPAARQKRGELSAAAVKDIEAILTADQKAKWPEIQKQYSALRGAGIPLEVVSDLKLSADQIQKIQAVEADAQKAMEAARQGGNVDRQAMAQLRQESQKKATDILTADQKTIVTKYEEAHPRPNRRRQANPPIV